jgi:hypothetical protein
MNWFRMYGEFIYDEKLEFLAFEDQRHYVFLLCMKSIGLLDKAYPLPGMIDEVVRRRLGIHSEALDNAKSRLIGVGLIDDNWQPVAWDKRQFASDSSVDRTRKYREKQRNVTETSQGRHSDAVDTETETEADTEETIYVPDESGTGDVPAKVSKEKRPPCPADKIVALYHELLPTCRQVAVITETRRSHLQQRWLEMYAAGEFKTQDEGLAAFADYFKYVSRSAFLTGRAKAVGDRKPFVADLEWLVKPGNFAKVIEGKYS